MHITKHDFQAFGWDNWDCIHCGVSGYTAVFDHCEDEKDYKKTYLYKKRQEEAKNTVKLYLTPAKAPDENAEFVKDLLGLLRKHKYIP